MEMINFDYRKLQGKIKEVFGTQFEYAHRLGISTASLNKKLNNKVEFKQSEIIRSVRLLHIDNNDIPLYFFTLEVLKTKHYRG